MKLLLYSAVLAVLYIVQAVPDFQVISESKSFTDAQASCEANGMTLAKDLSDVTHEAIVQKLKNAGFGGNDAWINGLQDDSDAWVTTDGEPLDCYHPWQTGEPNGSGRCLQLWAYVGHLWDDTPCSITKPSVCQPASYVIFSGPYTFDDAKATCEANGMELAKDLSDVTHKAIIQAVTNAGLKGTDVWINGLQDSSDAWVTTDGETFDCYHPWQSGEPNGSGRCLQLWAGVGYNWDDTPCSVKKPFVCI